MFVVEKALIMDGRFLENKDGRAQVSYPRTTGWMSVLLTSILDDVAIYGDEKAQKRVQETLNALMPMLIENNKKEGRG
jgi:hypothetical protein